MPNNTAFSCCKPLLGASDTIILVIATDLLLPLIKNDIVVYQQQKARLVIHRIQGAVEEVTDVGAFLFDAQIKIVAFLRVLFEAVVFPFQIVFFFCSDGAVAQAFAVVARHAELNGCKERLNEHAALIGQVLTDTVGYGNSALFQLDHRNGNAVDIDNQIGTLLIVFDDSDFFCDLKEIIPRGIPVDEVDSGLVFINGFSDLCTVFQQLVDLSVTGKQTVLKVCRCFDEFINSADSKPFCIAVFSQPCGKLNFVDIGIFIIPQTTDIIVFQLGLKKFDHSLLCRRFGLTYSVHYAPSFSVSLICPLSSSLIMPCLRQRYLVSFFSNSSISLSMSDNMDTMASCSSRFGKTTFIFEISVVVIPLIDVP